MHQPRFPGPQDRRDAARPARDPRRPARPLPRRAPDREGSGSGSGGRGWRILAGAAAAAAGLAVVNHLVARRAEERTPPIGRFINVDGVRLHYAEWGEGEPVVLINGNGTMAHDWANSGLVEALARSHRVVAIDRPGYGYSERPRGRLWTGYAQGELLARAFTRLGLYRPVIVGHSWGAIAALAAAIRHPRATRGLVLLSGYYYPTARLDVWAFAPQGTPVVGDLFRYTVGPAIGAALAPKLYERLFAPLPVPERFLEGFPHGLALRPSQLRASGQDSGLMVSSVADMEEHYGEIDMPVAVVTGSGDRLVDPRRHAFRLREELPNATLHVVEGAGHMVHYEAPDLVARAVDEVVRAAETRTPLHVAGSRPPGPFEPMHRPADL